MQYPGSKKQKYYSYAFVTIIFLGFNFLVSRHFINDVRLFHDQIAGTSAIKALSKFQKTLHQIRTLEQRYLPVTTPDFQRLDRDHRLLLKEIETFLNADPGDKLNIHQNLIPVVTGLGNSLHEAIEKPLDHFSEHSGQIGILMETIRKIYQKSRLTHDEDFHTYILSSFFSISLPRINNSLNRIQGLLYQVKPHHSEYLFYIDKIRDELVLLNIERKYLANDIKKISDGADRRFISEIGTLSQFVESLERHRDEIKNFLDQPGNFALIQRYQSESENLQKIAGELQLQFMDQVAQDLKAGKIRYTGFFIAYFLFSIALVFIFFKSFLKTNTAIQKYQRLVHAVSKGRQLLIYENNAARIYDNLCECLASAGYALVWIGVALKDEEKTVLPIAYKGRASEYVHKLTIRWGEDEFSMGPTGMAIKQNKVCITSNTENDGNFLPWRRKALEYQIRSSAALPLNLQNTTIGALCLYSEQRNAFQQEEIELVQNLIQDLMFNISVLHIRRQRDKARTLLELSNANLKKKVLERTRRVVEIQDSTVFSLGALVEARDKETGNHIRRTREFIRLILDVIIERDEYKNELTPEKMEFIYRAAPLHDIGKVGVPDYILGKPDMLTPEEFEIMKSHTLIGANTIHAAMATLTETDFLTTAEEIVRHHHEKWDGTGYPDGLKGSAIPLSARLMAIADVYDALISRRPYKEPYSHEKSVKIMKDQTGIHFDPDLMNVFLVREKEFLAVAMKYSDETI